MSYQDKYTWQEVITYDNKIGAILNKDGSVSVAITWGGYSTELKEELNIQGMLQNFRSALTSNDNSNIYIENHFLRAYDNKLCKEYVEYGKKNAVRYQEFSHYLRESHAELMASMAMSNQITTVFTYKHKFGLFAGARAKREIKKQIKLIGKLITIVNESSDYLPGANFLSKDEIYYRLYGFYHRDNGRSQQPNQYNNRFSLNSIVPVKPEYEDGFFKLGDTHTKVFLLLDYPDAKTNWFYKLANFCGCETHITQIISMTSAQSELAKSAVQSKKAIESASKLGGESEAGKLNDHNNFRGFVTENNLAVFANAYIVKLHHTEKNDLEELYRYFKQAIGSNVVISDSEEIGWAFWRVSQFGQGYKTPFLRPDHELLVANMAPIIKFSEGDKNRPEMLRLTTDAQAVAFSFPPDGTNHAVTAAKTGSGKGVLTVAQIAENYPLGTNYYIAEVGASYKWIVEAFGGSYFHLDPDTTVIQPFPDYSMAKDGVLSSKLIGTTIGALNPLLKQGANDEIAHHVTSVAEQIMQAMYENEFDEPTNNTSPTLGTFHDASKLAIEIFEGVQGKAARLIFDNLNSFLSSSTGSRFTEQNTLNFDAGIVGVDFKNLMSNEDLAKFMLVFVALRYRSIAFANSTPARILLDEQHEFSRIDEELIKTLNKQLTRMGRKEAGAYQGISQELLDMGLEPGILNQITNRELLYLQDGHDEVAKLIRLNSAALNRWKKYKDPESSGKIMDYRQCIRMVGEDVFDLHLKFSTPMLDLAHSSPKALKIKNEIGQLTNDPIERLKLFRQAMEIK